ncbi:MAG: RHS repeat-associated core domain-containing protein, partial [Planctomycetota bacterium]|nr:RHS repeat-associated core domain-containing protein [Planctomycetota bacterium]
LNEATINEAVFGYAGGMGWQMASQTVDGETRSFTWEYGGELLSETIPQIGTRRYTNGGVDQVLWASDSLHGTQYYLNDANGSVFCLASAGAGTLERQRYDAYGVTEVTNASYTARRAQSEYGNRLGFQGHTALPEVGLQYFRNRFYDPSVGRFLSRDPLGLVDGPAVYGAFGGNPVGHTDPMGLDWAVLLGNTCVGVYPDDDADTAKSQARTLGAGARAVYFDPKSGSKYTQGSLIVSAEHIEPKGETGVGNVLGEALGGAPKRAQQLSDDQVLAGLLALIELIGNEPKPEGEIIPLTTTEYGRTKVHYGFVNPSDPANREYVGHVAWESLELTDIYGYTDFIKEPSIANLLPMVPGGAIEKIAKYAGKTSKALGFFGALEEAGAKLGYRPGHHPIPQYLGGHKWQRMTENISRAVHTELHSKLTAELKSIGMSKGTILGSGRGKRLDWLRYFAENPGKQREALDKVFEVTREIDMKHGTNILRELWQNVLEGRFTRRP